MDKICIRKTIKLMKEIKEDLNNQRDILCSWLRKINIVNLSVLPDLTYKFDAITIKIPANYSEDTDKLILKFIWKGKKQNKTEQPKQY